MRYLQLYVNTCLKEVKETGIKHGDINKVSLLREKETIMAKYIVDYYETYSRSYEVEASSKEEAEEIVKNDIFEGRREEPNNCTDSWCEVEELK